jgi:hypothetical protein
MFNYIVTVTEKVIAIDDKLASFFKVIAVVARGVEKKFVILSSQWWWSKTQKFFRKKKVFFVLLTINLNKFSLLVRSYLLKKSKKSD